jgi:chemotaxis family two-component system sensor kinase Cph1
MKDFEVDLTNCDREPIHIPGKIQAHGFLVAINSAYTITYVSNNVQEFLSLSPGQLLGKPVNTLSRIIINHTDPEFITHLLQLGKHAQSFENINPYQVTIQQKNYNLIINTAGQDYLLEFEPVVSDLNFDLQRTIGRSVSGMLSGKHLQELLNNAAGQVKHIIKYDRVMIYKFLDDGHGHVIAEAANADLEPFLELHYPATDIPKQARQLYKANLTRIITDVSAEPSPISTLHTEGAEPEPLNLTNSALRAVSPIHIQYLKNMGVASSFSISLLYRDELWGLIACHNYSPRFIDFKAREAAKLVGQIISSALEFKQDEENLEVTDQFTQVYTYLSTGLRKGGDIKDALTKHSPSVLNAVQATGAAVIFENSITLLGHTPDEEQVKDLAAWLKTQLVDKVFHTHHLPALYPQAKTYSVVASGLLACLLSGEMGEMILWFKPEQIAAVNWAGDPNKPAEPGEDGVMQLSPRRSFDVWTETVRHTSTRWSNAEVASVLRLREEVVYAINRQANEIRILNEKLQQAYEELDTFSFTISHDLRTPLSTIKNYSELLLETLPNLDNGSKRLINKVISGADKMNFLIKEVLNYSQIGRAELNYVPVDMASLVREIEQDLRAALKPQNLTFTIKNTPEIKGDPTMITQVFSNLLNNAIKYSSRAAAPNVVVNGEENDNEVIYTIQDNGVGIDVNYYTRVFDLFKRMDNVQDYEGTGVGLAIVKRIVEKHKGRIWLESELGTGTIFYISFSKFTDAKS